MITKAYHRPVKYQSLQVSQPPQLNIINHTQHTKPHYNIIKHTTTQHYKILSQHATT